jgi:hypothetical protein
MYLVFIPCIPSFQKIDSKINCILYIIYDIWGVKGRVITVIDFKPIAPHQCGRFEVRQGLWILSCEEAVRNISGSNSVVSLCACNTGRYLFNFYLISISIADWTVISCFSLVKIVYFTMIFPIIWATS